MAVPVALIAMAASAAIKGVQAYSQSRKAKKLKRSLKDPDYKITKPIRENQALAESRGAQGLSDRATRLYEDQNNRGMAVGIDGILRAGGNANHIGSLFGSYLDGANKLALIDEDMRVKNLQQLIEQNQFMGSELDKEWQMNTYRRYADQVRAANLLKQQSNENFNSALDDGISLTSFLGETDFGATKRSLKADERFANIKPATNMQSVGRSSTGMTGSTESIAANLRNKYPGLMGGSSSITGPK